MPSEEQYRGVGAISLLTIDRFLLVPTIIWPFVVRHPVNTLRDTLSTEKCNWQYWTDQQFGSKTMDLSPLSDP